MGQSLFKGKLLVCDMDGTLLNSSSKISEGNIKAIERFVAGGGLFTVATGRMEKSVLPYLDVLPVNVPAIVYNGAAIYDFKAGRILWQADLDRAVAGAVRDTIERFPEIGVQVYHGGRSYFVRENKYTEAHRIREHFEPVRTDLDGVPAPWFKIIIAWDPPKLKDVEDFLRGYEAGGSAVGCSAAAEVSGAAATGAGGEHYGVISGVSVKGDESAACVAESRKAPFRQVYSEPQFLELLSPAATKGSALKVLTGMLGIDRSCVISMGDNLNDIELIQEAGTGIAVGNAHCALKAVAGLCCADHNNDPVSEVISWLENRRILS